MENAFYIALLAASAAVVYGLRLINGTLKKGWFYSPPSPSPIDLLTDPGGCGKLAPGEHAPGGTALDHVISFEDSRNPFDKTTPSPPATAFHVERTNSNPDRARISRKRSPNVLIKNNSSFTISWKLPSSKSGGLHEAFCNPPPDWHTLETGDYYRLRLKYGVKFHDTGTPKMNFKKYHGDILYEDPSLPPKSHSGDGDDMYLEC